MMAPVLELDSLSKSYGRIQALDGVSLSVDPGECVALLGPNGAGKSTLIDILATLIEPTSGEARVAGHSVLTEPGQVRRSIGVAFQEPIASKHLSPREVLLHHAQLYGLDPRAARARAHDLLASVGLAERADDRVSTFSGGMKRKCDLARVLMTEPELLALDEPTTGLDPRARLEVQDRLLALVDEGTTLLVATHDMAEAERLAHRVAVLDQGELIACDRPAALSRELGGRVVRIELGRTDSKQAVRDALAGLWGVGRMLETGDGIEVLLATDDPGASSPGAVVDALEDASVGYESVTVREPNLSDVFLSITGRPLAQPSQEVDA